MMQLMTLAALALTAAATPADRAPAASEPAATAAKPDQRAKTGSSKTKYCVMVDPTTGSRIARRECRTKADWESIGIDITNMK